MSELKIEIRLDELPDHVKDTMCRILLAAIRREKEQGKEG